MPTVYFVVPCYNEEEVLPETVKRLGEKLDELIKSGLASDKSRMMFIDDGSKDKTWNLISDYASQNKYVAGVKLSRNRGHQNALLSGLMTAKEYCDCAISLDADLQDDINVMKAVKSSMEYAAAGKKILFSSVPPLRDIINL